MVLLEKTRIERGVKNKHRYVFMHIVIFYVYRVHEFFKVFFFLNCLLGCQSSIPLK